MHMASSLRVVNEAEQRSRFIRAAGMASVLAGIFAGGGCGLRLDLLEPAPDGGAGHDAPGNDAPGQDAAACNERISASGRCEIPSLCGITSGCPASWADAQQPSSCSNGGTVGLAECGGTVRWTLFHEFTVLSCYYDPTNGDLQGFHEQADRINFCGGSASSRWVGNVPADCASDGGVYNGGFSCTEVDAGLDQPIPCGSTICAAGQYCRGANNNPDAATCDPSAGFSGGTCVAIPSGCAQTATCDCIAALNPGCACCFPRGGGVISCSGS